MKSGIHPRYEEITIKCTCGNSFITRSTLRQIKLEVCSQCHPFYTGKQKLFDTAGRVERFQKRYVTTGGKTVVRKAVRKKAVSRISKSARKILRNVPRVVVPTRKSKSKPS